MLRAKPKQQKAVQVKPTMPQGRFEVMVSHLLEQPVPTLPDQPGRVIRAADAPLPDDCLPFITSVAELALIAGISRHRAKQRITNRAETAHINERTNP